MKKKRFICMAFAAVILIFSACQTRHELAVEPVEIKPIHITIDVNIKVDKALNDFFSDIDEATEDKDAQ